MRLVKLRGRMVWEADWRDARGQRRRSYCGRTRAEAEQVLAKRIRDRDLELAGMGTERGLSMPIADVAAQYVADLRSRAKASSVADAKRSLELLSSELGVRTVRDVDRPAVMRWRQARLAEGAANKTLNNRIGVLKAALALCVRLGQLAANPLQGFRGLPVGPAHQVRRPRALSEWELQRLIAAAAESDRAAVRPRGFAGAAAPHHAVPQEPFLRALIATGARYGELVLATWADLDVPRGTLTFRAETTKNARPRTIPIDVELLAVLQALPVAHALALGRHPRPSDRIFLSPQGRPMQKGTANFGTRLREWLRSSGIEHRDARGVATVHSMRHSFCSRLARAGIPIATAQALTGHRTARVLIEVYSHVDVEDARAALDKLPARIRERAAPGPQEGEIGYPGP